MVAPEAKNRTETLEPWGPSNLRMNFWASLQEMGFAGACRRGPPNDISRFRMVKVLAPNRENESLMVKVKASMAVRIPTKAVIPIPIISAVRMERNRFAFNAAQAMRKFSIGFTTFFERLKVIFVGCYLIKADIPESFFRYELFHRITPRFLIGHLSKFPFVFLVRGTISQELLPFQKPPQTE